MVLKAFPSRFPSTSDLFPAQEEPPHEVASDQTSDCKHPAHDDVLRGRGFDRHQGEERNLEH